MDDAKYVKDWYSANDFDYLEEWYLANFSKWDLIKDYIALMRTHYGDEAIKKLAETVRENGQ